MSVTAYIGSVGIAPDGFEAAYEPACSPLGKQTRNFPCIILVAAGYVLLDLKWGKFMVKISLYGGTKDGLSLDDVKNYPIQFCLRSGRSRTA